MEVQGRKRNGITCPLCGGADVRYREKTNTRVCRQCEYPWYTIERCHLR